MEQHRNDAQGAIWRKEHEDYQKFLAKEKEQKKEFLKQYQDQLNKQVEYKKEQIEASKDGKFTKLRGIDC